MEDTNNTNDGTVGDLTGVPGLGPVRRAALVAAGITTRTELKKSSVEQIIGMTGMSRAAAEKVRAFLDAQMPEEVTSVSGDEAMPEALLQTEENVAHLVPDAADAADTELSDFDRAVFAAQTALADATRLLTGKRLQKPFVRLAKKISAAAQKSDKMGTGRRKRVHKRLLSLTARLETAAQKAPKLTPKRENKLRNRLQNESDAISHLLTAKTPAPFKAGEKTGK